MLEPTQSNIVRTEPRQAGGIQTPMRSSRKLTSHNLYSITRADAVSLATLSLYLTGVFMSATRLIRLFWLSLTVLALTACGASDKPEDVAQAYYKAAAAANVDAVLKLMYFKETPADQMAQAKGKVNTMINEIAGRARANDGLKKIEVLETSFEKENEAKVKVKVTFGNGKEHTESVELLRNDKKWQVRIWVRMRPEQAEWPSRRGESPEAATPAV